MLKLDRLLLEIPEEERSFGAEIYRKCFEPENVPQMVRDTLAAQYGMDWVDAHPEVVEELSEAQLSSCANSRKMFSLKLHEFRKSHPVTDGQCEALAKRVLESPGLDFFAELTKL